MASTVTLIGVETNELRWLRSLVSLLRHPDPSVPELARQALTYLTDAAGKRIAPAEPGTGSQPGSQHGSQHGSQPSMTLVS